MVQKPNGVRKREFLVTIYGERLFGQEDLRELIEGWGWDAFQLKKVEVETVALRDKSTDSEKF